MARPRPRPSRPTAKLPLGSGREKQDLGIRVTGRSERINCARPHTTYRANYALRLSVRTLSSHTTMLSSKSSRSLVDASGREQPCEWLHGHLLIQRALFGKSGRCLRIELRDQRKRIRAGGGPWRKEAPAVTIGVCRH